MVALADVAAPGVVSSATPCLIYEGERVVSERPKREFTSYSNYVY